MMRFRSGIICIPEGEIWFYVECNKSKIDCGWNDLVFIIIYFGHLVIEKPWAKKEKKMWNPNE